MGSHKRMHRTSFDLDYTSLPKKKFISEESFAQEMAAMSLDPQNYYSNTNNTQNVIRINDINEFLREDEEQKNSQRNDIPYMPIDSDKPTLVEVNFNGAILPLEIRPGESQPRIPDFVLQNSVLTDPRDLAAYKNLMRTAHTHKTIEVLNSPSVYSAPTDMDID